MSLRAHRFDDLVGGAERRRVILVLGSILGLQAADTGSVGALAGPIERAFDVGNTSIGLLVTVSTLVGCLVALPFGAASDRSNRARMLQVVVALWAVATVVSSLSVSFPMLLVTRIALGGVIGAAGPALASLFGDLVPGSDRSRLWSYVLTGELVGAGIGILVSGGLSGFADWRVAMGVLGIPAAGLAWAIGKYLPEPARGGQAYLDITDPDEVDLTSVEIIEEQAEEAGVEPEEELVLTTTAGMTMWDAAKYVLRIRTNVALIVASGLGYFFLAGLETFAELYFRDRYGVGQSAASLLFVLVAVGAVAGVLVSGKLTDSLIRQGHTTARVVVGAVGYVGALIAFIPGALAPSLAIAMPVLFLAAMCIGAVNPPVDAARLDIVPSTLWGRAEGIRTVLRQGLQGAAPLLFGLVSAGFGGGGAGLSTGVNTSGTTASAGAAHGLEMAFIVLALPMLLGGGLLWTSRSAYLREVVAARRSDENLRKRAG